MSADNGVYIGRFPGVGSSVEYRVIHAQAIENCDDSGNRPETHDQAFEGHAQDREIVDWNRVSYYGNAKTFSNHAEAFTEAQKLADDILSDEYCPILEYGICDIVYDRPLLDLTVEEANRKLAEF